MIDDITAPLLSGSVLPFLSRQEADCINGQPILNKWGNNV